jgi:hypothetical protein
MNRNVCGAESVELGVGVPIEFTLKFRKVRLVSNCEIMKAISRLPQTVTMNCRSETIVHNTYF